MKETKMGIGKLRSKQNTELVFDGVAYELQFRTSVREVGPGLQEASVVSLYPGNSVVVPEGNYILEDEDGEFHHLTNIGHLAGWHYLPMLN